jgi:hypothetical protein
MIFGVFFLFEWWGWLFYRSAEFTKDNSLYYAKTKSPPHQIGGGKIYLRFLCNFFELLD